MAPWGNHVLTYRLFEGLATRCLVIAQRIRNSRILDGELEFDATVASWGELYRPGIARTGRAALSEQILG